MVNVTQTWYGPVEFFFFTPDKLIVKHFDVCVTKVILEVFVYYYSKSGNLVHTLLNEWISTTTTTT